MPNLSCTVHNCGYNISDHCSLDTIQVTGGVENDSMETCCNSFLLRLPSLSNVNQQLCGQVNVLCDVSECKFNNGRVCSSDTVDIIGGERGIPEGTDCGTFRDH